MKKKSTVTDQTQSGSSTSYKCIFLFGQTNRWWKKILPGYTHVALILYDDIGHNTLFIEPELSRAYLEIQRNPPPDKLINVFDAALEVTITPTFCNRLIRPVFQSCTTIIQYLAGISLGCITAQGLYKCLTTRDGQWLRDKGILEVRKWEETLNEWWE